MEVEEPPPAAPVNVSRSGCFPMEPFKCLPMACLTFIPGTWQKIVDAVHFTLVFGVLCMVGLCFQVVYIVSQMQCTGGILCIKELMILIFIAPCAMYTINIIGQYDERLQNKQAKAKEAKKALTLSYNNILSDMDNMLQKSAESSAGLAERSFESKRRDFQRFLERARPRFDTMYSGKKSDSDQLLKQFRRFCMDWLKVFEECSIDPTNKPQVIATPDEVNACTSIAEVAELLLERLKVTEVRFISAARDQNQQIVSKHKNMLTNIQGQAAAVLGASAGEKEQEKKHWFSCGCGQGCSCCASSSEEGFPKECRCICLRAAMLSPEHIKLVIGFLMGLPIAVLEAVPLLPVDIPFFSSDNKGKGAALLGTIMVIIAEVCFVLMLCRFEELDIIQQLEREVKELEKQNQQVQEQNNKMKEFWNNAQQLTELWLYRTVPRLDLYKEIHSQLEDSSKDDLLANICQANQHLEDLQLSIGSLDAWRNDGCLNSEDKKKFGKLVTAVYAEADISDILSKLDDVTKNKMSFLQIADAPSQKA